jgi:predicted RNA-binding Zn-ribbon protein involved in translation (DUF1610 family)
MNKPSGFLHGRIKGGVMSVVALLVIVGLVGLVVVSGVIAVVVVLTTSKRQSGTANPNLFPCPDCGRQVSRLAKSCPNCGRPLASEGQAGGV